MNHVLGQHNASCPNAVFGQPFCGSLGGFHSREKRAAHENSNGRKYERDNREKWGQPGD
jgi:hypothetical protein